MGINIKRAVFITALLGLIMVALHALTGSSCFYESTIGLPCPGCGLTRAWLAFFAFDIKAAFFYHPLFLFPPVFAVLLLKKRSAKWFKAFCAVSVAAFIGVFAVRMVLFFPHTEPMRPNNRAIAWRVAGLALDVFGFIKNSL